MCLCDKIYVLVTKMDGITWSETRFSAVAFGEERWKTPHSLHHVLPNARSHKHIKYLSMSKDGSGFGSSHCEHIERFGVGVMGTQPPSHSSCDALHSECKGMCERFLCMCVHGFNPSSYFMNTKAVATRNYTPPNTHSRHHISANTCAQSKHPSPPPPKLLLCSLQIYICPNQGRVCDSAHTAFMCEFSSSSSSCSSSFLTCTLTPAHIHPMMLLDLIPNAMLLVL